MYFGLILHSYRQMVAQYSHNATQMEISLEKYQLWSIQ